MQTRTMVADPMTEARERLNIVSFLEEARGTLEPKKQNLLDAMGAVLANEKGGLEMYRQFSQKTSNETLKERWQEFGEETNVHVQVAQRVITSLGGDPNSKSAVAKDIEKCGKAMLEVSAQGEAADFERLGHLVMAESICKLHWKGVSNLARRIKDPSMAKVFWDASRIAERDEDEHVIWNTTMFDTYMEKVATGQ